MPPTLPSFRPQYKHTLNLHRSLAGFTDSNRNIIVFLWQNSHNVSEGRQTLSLSVLLKDPTPNRGKE